MRIAMYCVTFFSIFLLLTGCTDAEKEKEIANMNKEELFDIYYIKKAPKANESHELSEIIKIVLTKNEQLTDDTIAIDVEKNGIYIDPSISSLGIRASQGTKQIDDVEQAIDLLEKYKVQDWKEDYSTEEDPSSSEDGGGWHLWLQYKDGTVQSHKGSGGRLESVTPEGFDGFFDELNTFVEERLELDTK